MSPTATQAPPSSGDPVRLLVSACLLGEHVRYDGQHKRDAFLVDQLGPFVRWERVCPEVDCGLPVPRPSMNLQGDPEAPRLIDRNGVDHTPRMQRFIEQKLAELEGIELCGYVCKKGSPSSGMERVKVTGPGGMPRPIGAGLFTAAFRARFPQVPVEEEGRLNDPQLRESFLERVFCRRRWLDLVAGGLDRGRLVQFHADHKLQILTHGRVGYTALGRLVAQAGLLGDRELFDRYEAGFMAAMVQRATIRKVTDVLQHVQGHFKKLIGPDEKAELGETIEAYRGGLVPLVVPVTLLKHHVRRHGLSYLARQVFLSPYPAELMLRNHV